MILIAIVNHAENLNDIRNQLNAVGATKFIAEVPLIVLPKNMGQVMVFADQIKPIMEGLKMTGNSKFSAMMLEVELKQLPNT